LSAKIGWVGQPDSNFTEKNITDKKLLKLWWNDNSY